jgi:hypothetical protein
MTEHPTIWRDMTAEEKGALLLAHHEGKVIQLFDKADLWFDIEDPEFADGCAYRVKPEPTVETVTIYGPTPNGSFVADPYPGHDYPLRVTYATTRGKPDRASIRMEDVE